MKITEFNRQNLRVLTAEIEAALAVVAKNHGLTSIKIIGGSFSSNSFKTKLEALTCPKKEDPIFLANQKYALRSLGLPENAIGQRFTTISGKTFQIDRIDPKKYKMPVIALEVVAGSVTTKGFKFPVNQVLKHLETQGA